MDPVTIISLLGGVLSCVRAILDSIDKAQQANAAEHEAFKELRMTIVDVEADIKLFRTMISVLESPDNEISFAIFIQRSAIS